MRVVALAGGTGSAKLLRGLSNLRVNLTVVGNVGDNIWMHGLYICPDLDIAMYTLAGIADKKQGWGIEGDTYEFLSQLRSLGEETWFKLGDRDLATHVIRTKLLKDGKTLTEVTETLRKELRVEEFLLPATDDPLETRIATPAGLIHLQEFWVRDHGRPRVTGVVYDGSSKAMPTERATKAITDADRVVICPANPVTSIGPMLALPGFVESLSTTAARVTALSPMLGRAPFTGPAAKLLRAVGVRSDSLGVAKQYAAFLDAIIIDRRDASLMTRVEELGVACLISSTRIRDGGDEIRLARELLEA